MASEPSLRRPLLTPVLRHSVSPWLAALPIVLAANAAHAACIFAPQGEGRVGAILDGRSFRLDDGREIRLAGIEPVSWQDRTPEPLAALIADQEVSLRGPDDAPDRYGRQASFVFRAGSETSVQTELLRRGQALFSGLIADRTCATELAGAEAAARVARQGVWSSPGALKNAESPGDILASAGQFVVVEGKALSVRQSGPIFYVNFGRRWTEGFAVTISRRMIATLEAAGMAPKSLENRRLRVRGWVERRGGPRIDIYQTGQIELVGDI